MAAWIVNNQFLLKLQERCLGNVGYSLFLHLDKLPSCRIQFNLTMDRAGTGGIFVGIGSGRGVLI